MTMLTQLADVARKSGFPVVEVSGWKTRGHGQMSGIETITCHHTANGGAKGDAPSLAVVRDGRPGLSGPLAHFVLGRSGTIYVVAAGLCYHAGVSLRTAYTNPHAIGIEAEAEGTGSSSDWPDAQMEAYGALCRVLINEFGLSVSDVRGHKETCSPVGRKSDPSFNMNSFRSSIPSKIEPEEEDDVAFSDRHKLTEADAKAYGDPSIEGDTKSYDELVRFPPATARLRREVDEKFDSIEKKIDALTALITSKK
jgi:hypothetical protein